MSADSKQIDLIIQSEIKNGKTITQVTQSIKELKDVLKEQTAAAATGKASLDELRATMLALQQAQDRLKSQDQLITNYQRLGDATDRAAARLQTAQTKLDAYQKKLDESGKSTDAQTDRLSRYAKSVETAQRAVTASTERQKQAAEQLSKLGLDTKDLAAEQLRLRTAMADTGVAIQAAETNIVGYAANIRRLREEEAKLANEAAFAKQLRDAEQLAKADRYLNFFEEAIRDANIQLEKLELNKSLQRTAQDAIASARGYRVLSTAVTEAQAPMARFRDVIDDILNPSARRNDTLATMESDLKKLQTSITSINGPIKNYRETLGGLMDVQSRIQGTSTLIDQFARQREVVAAAGKEFTAARSQVENYAKAVANSANLEAGARNQLLQSLNQAQSRQAAAAVAVERERAALKNLREELNAAGVDTRNLNDAQERLLNSARSATTNLNQLADAHKKYGTAVTRSASSMSLFDDNGRTTLSLMQRIRGQLLSLTAGYVSLFGAMRLGNESIEAYNAKISAINQLSLSTGGDMRKAGEEFEYAVGQADRLGVAINEAVTGYAKFSASATLAGRPAQENRFVYETMLEISRVAGLSADQLNRVFFALGQIDSKGKVMAEEFNQQLGDAIPGLTGVARQATQGMFEDFSKAMKDGKVDLDALVDILAEFRSRISGQLPNAMNTLQAAQTRLNNEFYKFRIALAEGGLADSYGDLIAELTAFFKSGDGRQFARDLAEAFRSVGSALVWLVRNIELVQSALKIIFVIFSARAVAGMVASIGQLSVGMAGLSTATLTAGTSFATMSAALLGVELIVKRLLVLVTALTTGLVIGDYLASQTEIGKTAFFELARWGEIAFKSIVAGYKIVFEEYVAYIKNIFGSFTNLMIDYYGTLLETPLRLLGKTDQADALARTFNNLRVSISSVGDASKETREQLARDIRFLRSLSLDDGIASVTQPSGSAEPTDRPDRVGGGKPSDTAKEAETMAKKQASLREQLLSAIESINAKILRSDKETLDSQLAAVDETYKKAQRLAARFTATGATDAVQLAGELQTAVSTLRAQIHKQFADKIYEQEDRLQKQLETLEARVGRRRTTDLEARLQAIDTEYAKFFRDLSEQQDVLSNNGIVTTTTDNFKKRAELAVADAKIQETRKFNLEELARLERQLTEVVQERNQREEAFKNRMQAGLATELETRDAINNVIQETQPKIEELANAAIAFAESLRGATDIDPTKLDALIAKAKTLSAEGLHYKTALEQVFDQSFNENAVQGIDNIAKSLGNVIAGTETWKDLLTSLKNEFINFIAQLLRDLALAILRTYILKSIQQTSWGSSILGATGASVMHTGGKVGRDGTTRQVDPSLFVGAPRYHSGGIAGLAPGEYPAILKRNEEVLTENDPRNVLNGGANPSSPANIRIINTFDSASFLSEGLATQEGTEAIMNLVRANRGPFKQILGN